MLGAKLIDRLREALLGCTNGVFLHLAVACPGDLAAIRAHARRGSYAKTEEDQARQLHSNLLENCSILNAMISSHQKGPGANAPRPSDEQQGWLFGSQLSNLSLLHFSMAGWN